MCVSIIKHRQSSDISSPTIMLQLFTQKQIIKNISTLSIRDYSKRTGGRTRRPLRVRVAGGPGGATWTTSSGSTPGSAGTSTACTGSTSGSTPTTGGATGGTLCTPGSAGTSTACTGSTSGSTPTTGGATGGTL